MRRKTQVIYDVNPSNILQYQGMIQLDLSEQEEHEGKEKSEEEKIDCTEQEFNKLAALLISEGHSNPWSYGYSFAKAALQVAREKDKRLIQNFVTAIAIAFAKDPEKEMDRVLKG